MEISNLYLTYFSATYTTAKIAKLIAEQINGIIKEYDITQNAIEKDVICEKNDLLVIAAPVYAGRIPAKAFDAFSRFKGNNTPAIIVCVYGNRDYDDAVLEMKDLVESNGFRIISAGAFIAQHSIFPKVAPSRPDQADLSIIRDFGRKNKERIAKLTDLSLLSQVIIKGNKPYKTPGKIPIKPRCNRNCNGCGKCARLCPVSAIAIDTPHKTDKKKCIACGRCITVCPKKARHFGGLLYKFASNRFVKANAIRKEPETIFAI